MAALPQPPPFPARGRRGALGPGGPGEPERKRVCKLLETIPGEANGHLVDCGMELDPRQKLSPDCGPWAAKTKQNSMVLENHGSKGGAQPCPRCIAGESRQCDIKKCRLEFEIKVANQKGHFSHILGF